MAKCNCAGNQCGCSVVGGSSVTITGVGTKANPFVVNVDLSGLVLNTRILVSDSNDIDFTIVGTGTGVDPIIISGTLKKTYQERSGYAKKSTDQNVISSTTPVAATDLSLAVAASKQYLIEAQLFYTAAAAGDIKVGLTAPAGATIDWTLVGLPTGASAVGDALIGAGVAAVGGTHSRGGIAAKVGATLRGVLTVDSTAGNIAVTFAQDTSTATNTTLHAGSTLRATLLN